MTTEPFFERLQDLAREWPDGGVHITLDDDRTVTGVIVEASTQAYEGYSHGIADLTVEFAEGVFEAHEDFPSDVGYIYQRQTGRDDFTDPVLNVWGAGENGPTETCVGTITSVEEVDVDE